MWEALPFQTEDRPRLGPWWNLQTSLSIDRGDLELSSHRGFWKANPSLIEDIVPLPFEIFVGSQVYSDVEVACSSSLDHVALAAYPQTLSLVSSCGLLDLKLSPIPHQ